MNVVAFLQHYRLRLRGTGDLIRQAASGKSRRDVVLELGVLWCVVIAGCNISPPAPATSVHQLVSERTKFDIPFDQDHSPAVDSAVTDLLSQPLTADTAVHIALLNNRTLAVQLEEVGIAEADYVAASQIKNPSIYVDFRPPDRGPSRATDIEASATEDVLDILLLPLRKKIAQQGMDRAAMLSADAALQLIHDVRVAFFTFIADQQKLKLQQQMTDAAAASEEFARRQHDAGNINDLDWANQQAAHAEAQLESIHAETRLAQDREQINRLLCVSGLQVNWSAVDSLPAVSDKELDEPAMLASARSRRLDLAAGRQQVALAEQALTYSRYGLLTEVQVGASMERETDKQVVIGPSLSLELPIFNQHQGQITRAEAEARQARKKLDAMQVTMESEIRLAVQQTMQARSAVKLVEATLVPQRQAVTAATQEQYNGMLVGLYALLAAKQSELTARRESIEALLDYWVARADLDRAAGR
jgi:cobalt-zinc-cadmium efflux system outer membrane protein